MQKKRLPSFSLLTLSLGLIGFVVGASNVQAQVVAPQSIELQTTTTQSPPVSGDVIVQRESVADQLNDLRATLRGQILEYREAEGAFVIARNELEQLQTLAATENAVAATKKVQNLRTMVLITYTRLLRLSILDTTSMSLPVKTKSLAALEVILKDLEAHQALIQRASTRGDLQFVADDFALISPRLIAEANFGRAALRAARLRNAFTATKALVTELESRDATAAATLKQAERKRAFEQIDQTVKSTENQLLEVENYLAIADSSERMNRDMEEFFVGIYAGNSQVLAYVQEVYSSFFQDTP